MVFESFLDPIFSPVLELPPLLGILLISLFITIIITLVYKFTTNQDKIKALKKEMKSYQDKMKKLGQSDPKKAMAVQKKAMEKNFEYMKHSMKPTLYTFIPIIIIFGWLNSHMAYMPLEPDELFSIDLEFEDFVTGEVYVSAVPELEFQSSQTKNLEGGVVGWQAKGPAGKYTLTFDHDGRSYEKKLLISAERRYEEPEKRVDDAPLKKISVGNEKIRPFGNLDLFGWNPGWLATYIISSMVFSTLLRKLMKLA